MNSKIFLDTHVFLWAIKDPQKIGPETLRIINSATKVYVSAVSLWELAMKQKVGKFSYDTEELMRTSALSGFELVPLEAQHLTSYEEIVLPHNDPFDALLLAQSEYSDCVFVTVDKQILSQVSKFNLQNAKK